ncbi:hypothetical protein D3H35_06600 [Cohnella faecalis]|uniref:Uncharacterized protein n=1 Tax=Cohnella faecalis TaxID=2315694 RepID=A0A398CUA3_9BACL|nr:hypothetical protein D3H35_06600 [Cohnella faecalis]
MNDGSFFSRSTSFNGGQPSVSTDRGIEWLIPDVRNGVSGMIFGKIRTLARTSRQLSIVRFLAYSFPSSTLHLFFLTLVILIAFRFVKRS